MFIAYSITKRTFLRLFRSLFLLFVISPVFSGSILPLDQAFIFSYQVTPPNTVLLKWKIAPNTYLYRDRIKVEVLSPQATTIKMTLPAAKVTPKSKGQLVYSDELIVPIDLQATEKNVVLNVSYQGCSQSGFCYLPVSEDIHLTLSNITAAKNSALTVLQTHNIVWIILSFLGFGLLLAFTPCILPMIPILSGIILGHQRDLNPRRAFILSVIYVFAMASTYAMIGILISLLGHNLQTLLQTPSVLITFSILFIILACSLFGWYELQLPQRWRHKIGQISGQQTSGSYFGVAVMGVLSTLIVSPCVTPPLVGALAYIANTGNVWVGGLALFAMGIGIGVPLLIVGTLGAKFLPKTGAWMLLIKHWFGFMLLAMAILLLRRVLTEPWIMWLWSTWLIALGLTTIGAIKFKSILSIRGIMGLLFILLGLGVLGAGISASFKTHKIEAVSAISDLKTLQIKLNAAQQLHKPVIVDFYADWCSACKNMDKEVFDNPTVHQKLTHYELLRVDITRNNKNTRALEQYFNVVAPPTLIFFDKQGKLMPDHTVIGEMSAKEFLQQLESL